MINFLVFCGEGYYASGGANDYVAAFDDEIDAIKYAESIIGKEKVVEKSSWSDDPDDDTYEQIEWAHVLNVEKCEIVFKCGVKPYGEHAIRLLEIRER